MTGLARSGKTALLTSIAANLLALGAGRPALPALAARLGGRRVRVATAPAAAAGLPRFDVSRHLAALVADPPRWPERTEAASLLALDLDLPRAGLAASLPPRRLRLEFLDYPGEWLLDLPLLARSFAEWSAAALRRLEAPETAPVARDFLGFLRGLPAAAPGDETLAATGHALYRTALHRLRDEVGLSFLQPGRFLMPAPGPEPPWMAFFPMTGGGPLAGLLRARFDAYLQAVRRDLVSPLFGDLDRLVVLADVLAALHAGPAAFADAAAALGAASEALRWRRGWADWLGWETLEALLALRLPSFGISRVAYVATKADHVAARQRGNLAALTRRLTAAPREGVASAAFAVAAVRCTEDVVETLEGRPVSAVRGRRLPDGRMLRSYPGEVPETPPDAAFWAHPFLDLPVFEPVRPPDVGRGGVPQIGLDEMLGFLLEDLL